MKNRHLTRGDARTVRERLAAEQSVKPDARELYQRRRAERHAAERLAAEQEE